MEEETKVLKRGCQGAAEGVERAGKRNEAVSQQYSKDTGRVRHAADIVFLMRKWRRLKY